MRLKDVVLAWTHCYHITYAANLPLIRRRGELLPALHLLSRAGIQHLAVERRADDLRLNIEGVDVMLRNQRPLDPGALELRTGRFDDYVACLNSRTFFWPGTASGPVADGRRMFERRDGPRSIVIRVPTRALFEANAFVPFDFSACNSGAAWVENGRKTYRAPELFKPHERFAQGAREIWEISSRASVVLPADSACSDRFDGCWRGLYE
jgi:hypothetical protein